MLLVVIININNNTQLKEKILGRLKIVTGKWRVLERRRARERRAIASLLGDWNVRPSTSERDKAPKPRGKEKTKSKGVRGGRGESRESSFLGDGGCCRDKRLSR